jgi:hypothetical protein
MSGIFSLLASNSSSMDSILRPAMAKERKKEESPIKEKMKKVVWRIKVLEAWIHLPAQPQKLQAIKVGRMIF